MERTKNTQVWVNGQEQTNYNSNDTLGTAQEYVLSDLIPGQENTITVPGAQHRLSGGNQ